MIGRVVGAVTGSIVAAVGAAACCAPPIFAGLMGTGMSGLGGQLEPYRPWVLGASAASFLFGFVWVERHPPCGCVEGMERGDSSDSEAGIEHVCGSARTRRTARVVLWTGLVLSALMAFYPTWSLWL